LTPLTQAFAQLGIGDFNGLGRFVLKNRAILAQPQIDNLLSEAAYAQRAGKEAVAQKYVHHAVLLQKCSKCRPEGLEPLFQRLATKGETTKDLIADVKKAHDSIRSQYAAPEPQRPERVAQGRATAVPEQGRAGNPEPRIIQAREQREVIPHQSIDQTDSQLAQSQVRQARDKDGQRVYVDSQSREIRPASGRHESQRSRRDSQTALPTEKISKMTLDDPEGNHDYETSVLTERNLPTSANPRPEQAIDSPMGPPGVGNQQQQRYSIEGTAGDMETLDAGELVPLC
jgi:Cdc37 Hsp90 binding domain